MLQVNVRVDTSNLISRLDKGQRRLAYAVANALNATARDIQTAERSRVSSEFTLRNPTFILRQAAIIRPFASATQGRAYVDVSVGKKPRLLLSRFEEGGDRPPFKGSSVAVPITGESARPQFGQPVTPSLRFSALKLRLRRGRGRSSVRIRRGEERTYMIPGVGVFQRDSEGSRLIYSFESDVNLSPRLRFIDTARRVTHERFRRHLRDETVNAIIRAGGRGL